MTIWDLLFPVLMPPVRFRFERGFDLFKPLYRFQPAGIDFLVKNTSALLADEMGTGKTVMSVLGLRVLFRLGKVRRVLIVCPVGLIQTWQDHLSDWAPELGVTVARGPVSGRRLDWQYPAHVYLTNYRTVASDFHKKPLVEEYYLNSFDLVLIDEAQYIKNPGSQRSRVLRKLASQYRWALTGTPMENRVDDVVALFRFIKPGLFRANELLYSPEVTERIRPYFLRRLKSDVMKDLPEKSRQEIWLELDRDQMKAYLEVERTGVDELERQQGITRVHIFALIMKLKQLCNFAPGKLTSAKTVELIDQVEEIKESGQKVIVFTQYRKEGVEKLYGVLRRFGVSTLMGGMSDYDRAESIDRFKKDPDIAVLLATIKTGGVGLTLTEASYVIHFDHWWNPAIMWQAEDRIHRAGQKRNVNIYSFWTKGTIEERIHEVLQRKELLIDEVINELSAKDIESKISMEDWLEVLGVGK